MLETTMTVPALIANAGTGVAAILGNYSGFNLIVGTTAGAIGVGLLLRWTLKAVKALRRV